MEQGLSHSYKYYWVKLPNTVTCLTASISVVPRAVASHQLFLLIFLSSATFLFVPRPASQSRS